MNAFTPGKDNVFFQNEQKIAQKIAQTAKIWPFNLK